MDLRRNNSNSQTNVKMAANVTITFLPQEIISLFLEYENIEIRDVINFSQSCTHFNSSVKSDNKLWKKKFFQRWPKLRECYNEYHVQNWLKEVEECMKIKKQLHHELSLMSGKNYAKEELSHAELQQFDPELGFHKLAYSFLIDELSTLIKYGTDLTIQYYARKVIRYLKEERIKVEWKHFINLEPNLQTMEFGASLLSQWSQPEQNISYKCIAKKLDKIAELVKDLLREQHPSHSIFSQSKEQMQLWRCTNIIDNQWTVLETRQILNALNQVLFQRLGFHGNSQAWQFYDNFFLDKVLENKTGVPITLSIVFESVARRLGIKCEPLSFKSHFLLRWKESYGDPKNKDIKTFYLDIFSGGQLLTRNDCPRIAGSTQCPFESHNIHSPAPTIEVMNRMSQNLEYASRISTNPTEKRTRLKSAMELQHMIDPYNVMIIENLARFHITYSMDLTEIIAKLDEVLKVHILYDSPARLQAVHQFATLKRYQKEMISVEPTKPQKRPPGIIYTIGLIMRHKSKNYNCVIIGWKHPFDPPVYDVFTEGGSLERPCQDTLEMAPPFTTIDRPEIGRYFTRFDQTHYVPNDELNRQYPEDSQIRNELVRRMYGFSPNC